MCYMYSFFFNDTATTEIYSLSLHDALPISHLFFTREDFVDRRYGALLVASRTQCRLFGGRSRGRRGSGGRGCGGWRGAASLRCDAIATGHSRRGDVGARTWGGREWRIASRGDRCG